MPTVQSRRRFLTEAAFTCAAGLGGMGAIALSGGRRSFAAEPPPEITTIHLAYSLAVCEAPGQIANALLRAEGFTDIRYVEVTDAIQRRSQAESLGIGPSMIAHGEIDLDVDFVIDVLPGMDKGAPTTILAGIHSGCYEIFGRSDIRSIADLKGRRVGAAESSYEFWVMQLMTSYIGLKLGRDIPLLSDFHPLQLYLDGKIDAFAAFPSILPELRKRNIGHTIASSIADRPRSQYYCCVLHAETHFVQRYPIATKRVVRAILKATDLCAREPERVARFLAERGLNYDDTLSVSGDTRYDIWRDYDPEDTLRFYALRMKEVGMVKSTPQELIALHTDWRFLNELKRELKT